jgi:hypothetical protein
MSAFGQDPKFAILMAVGIQIRAKSASEKSETAFADPDQSVASPGVVTFTKISPLRGHLKEEGMSSLAQRAAIVLEHASAISDHDEESYEDSWCVVAYLVLDSGKRTRVTLHRCKSRSEASVALKTIWDQVITERAQIASAA